MGNLIVIIVVAFILFLAIKPIIKHNKNKGNLIMDVINAQVLLVVKVVINSL